MQLNVREASAPKQVQRFGPNRLRNSFLSANYHSFALKIKSLHSTSMDSKLPKLRSVRKNSCQISWKVGHEGLQNGFVGSCSSAPRGGFSRRGNNCILTGGTCSSGGNGLLHWVDPGISTHRWGTFQANDLRGWSNPTRDSAAAENARRKQGIAARFPAKRAVLGCFLTSSFCDLNA
jgi:hypothetical protein